MTLKFFFAALLSIMTAYASASVLTFENLGVPGGVSAPGFNAGGYQFSDKTSVFDVSPGSLFGEGTNGAHSGNYAILNDFDFSDSMQMTRIGGGLMSVENLWIHGWFGLPNDVVIEGYRDGVAVQTVVFSFGSNWDAVQLGFKNIDTLSFFGGGPFFVDDIKITPVDNNPGTVPEPTTLLLFSLGFVGLAFARMRRT